MDSKAAMLKWDDFHARARRVIPKRKLKPRCCFIGVLNHEKNPQAYLEETDLVWMMGHKVSILDLAQAQRILLIFVTLQQLHSKTG
jgi:hypothetical protein